MTGEAKPLIGVVGAGTMGGGIAQVAAMAGYQVQVQDVSAEILNRFRQRLEEHLAQRVSRGRLGQEEANAALSRLHLVTRLDDLKGAGVIIEAAPESLDLKREIFRQLGDLCGPEVVLASNTSSLPITALAGGARHPERVVGMHFFNPVPAMALVEIIRGARTSATVAEAAAALARAMGKTPVQVADGPGFLVNRIARPFYGEALRLLAEGAGPVEVIDRIMREAGGFRMGPFELLDLIGLDVSLAVTRSIYDAFFQDPRYRPHPLQQRMVDAGLLGRKSGRGFYDYTAPAPASGPVTDGPLGTQRLTLTQDGVSPMVPVAVLGDSRVAAELVIALRAMGLGVVTQLPRTGRWRVALAIDASIGEIGEKAQAVAEIEAHLPADTILLALTLSASVTEAAARCARPERVVGFATLPPLADQKVIEVQAGLRTGRPALDRSLTFWAEVGKRAVEVGDGAGGIFPRIQAMLCHEAIVALAEGIATAPDIDTAMRLGVNYPQGPIERAEAAGLDTVLAVVSGLFTETADPRYRPAPLLRRLVAAGCARVETDRRFHLQV